MTKSHAWRFFADGPRHPASAIRSRSSSDTGSGLYSRTLRRARIASQASIPFLPRLRLPTARHNRLGRLVNPLFQLVDHLAELVDHPVVDALGVHIEQRAVVPQV